MTRLPWRAAIAIAAPVLACKALAAQDQRPIHAITSFEPDTQR